MGSRFSVCLIATAPLEHSGDEPCTTTASASGRLSVMEEQLPPGKYWVLGEEGPDRRRVSFRVGGERCNPDEITKLTGLQPSLAHRAGDDRVSGGRVINQYREGI